jgi:hypothetical protein
MDEDRDDDRERGWKVVSRTDSKRKKVCPNVQAIMHCHAPALRLPCALLNGGIQRKGYIFSTASYKMLFEFNIEDCNSAFNFGYCWCTAIIGVQILIIQEASLEG